MKWFKLTLLLLLTIAAMRLCSWVLKWILTKALPGRRKLVALLANGACLAAFVSWLYYDLLPGEPIDIAALVFGLLVFGIFALWDARTPTASVHFSTSD